MKSTLLLAGILGGAIPVLAQTAPPASSPVFNEDVVVTASLAGEARDEVTATVTVIDAEEIDARQATGVAELLATVPGVTVARSGSPGKVTSVFTRGTDSNQTLVLWNGVPLNDPFFAGFDFAFLPTEGVERVEAVRGPFSALYGSDAVGGVVQVLTGRQQGLRARLEAGEDSYHRASLAAGRTFGEFHLDVTGHSRRGDGRVSNDFYDGDELTARGYWKPRPALSVALVARAAEAEVGIPFSGTVPTPERTQAQESLDLTLPVSAQAGGWSVDLLVSRAAADFAFRDPAASFDRNDTESHVLRGRGVASHALGNRGSVAFGGEWQRQEVSNVSTFGVNLEEESQRTWAAFAQLRWSFDRAQVDLGLRRDENEFYGDELSPKLAVALVLGPDTRLRASYGEGFRAPALGELFFPFSGNPDLQPETSESYELALEHRAGPWNWQLVGFENRQRNLIDFDLVSFTNINVGRAESRGVEAVAAYEGRAFTARFNATYLEAEDRDTGEPLLRRPEQSATLVLTWRPRDWTFNLVGRYVGDRPDGDPADFSRVVTNPSYTRFDLAARWQAVEHLAPYARLENLADEDYAEVAGFPAPGRTFVGGLALSF